MLTSLAAVLSGHVFADHPARLVVVLVWLIVAWNALRALRYRHAPPHRVEVSQTTFWVEHGAVTLFIVITGVWAALLLAAL